MNHEVAGPRQPRKAYLNVSSSYTLKSDKFLFPNPGEGVRSYTRERNAYKNACKQSSKSAERLEDLRIRVDGSMKALLAHGP